MKRKSQRSPNDITLEEQEIISGYNINSKFTKKKLKTSTSVSDSGTCDNSAIVKQIHESLEIINRTADDTKKKPNTRMNNAKSMKLQTHVKQEESNSSNNVHSNNAVNLVKRDVLKPQSILDAVGHSVTSNLRTGITEFAEKLKKCKNVLSHNIGFITLDDFNLTEDEKRLACPFKERRLKRMSQSLRQLPYVDNRLNANDVDSVFLKWQSQLRNIQKRFGHPQRIHRSVVPSFAGDVEFERWIKSRPHYSNTCGNEYLYGTSDSISKQDDFVFDDETNCRRLSRTLVTSSPKVKLKSVVKKDMPGCLIGSTYTQCIDKPNGLENQDTKRHRHKSSQHSNEPYNKRTRSRLIMDSDSGDEFQDHNKEPCPICGEMINVDSLQIHANRCLDKSEAAPTYRGAISDEDDALPEEVLQIQPNSKL